MYAIRKIAENHVELRKSRTIETATKQTVEAYVDPPEAYGMNRVQEELANIEAERARINAFDTKAELAKLKEKEDMLIAIETALQSATDGDYPLVYSYDRRLVCASSRNPARTE